MNTPADISQPGAQVITLEMIQGLMAGIRPEPRMTVDQWADQFRKLSSVASAEPGQWKTSRTPYLQEIMIRLSTSDPCEQIVFMKGAQIGATEMGFNWIGYIIDIAPSSVLLVQPTDMVCKRNSKIRFEPMIESTPRLKAKIKPARSKDSGNTTLQKEFAGGVAILTGANSAVGLRSMPVKYLFLDEIDGYPDDLDGEGSPVELAKARTRTFAKRKIFECSTPTIENRSIIEKEFDMTDKRFYFVPCPHCGGMQHLKWEQMRWTNNKAATAKYQCEHCGQLIEERHKTDMLASGNWMATVPDNVTPKRYGYHLNSLYSPLGWFSWADAVQTWLDAQKDPNKMKVFMNTVLGITSQGEGDAPAWENLFNRREKYQTNIPPKGVMFITVGVDVQKDRIELEVVGWCRDKSTFSIDYRVLMGDTAASPVWQDLAKVVDEQWVREDGIILPCRLMAVDTGFNTSHVYDFCRKYDVTRVIPVKGQDNLMVVTGPPKYVDKTVTGKKGSRLRLFHIGVSMIKSEIYAWLKQEKDDQGVAPHGFCHFPEYGPDYFKGLTAEQVESRLVKGFRKYQWVKKYARNEPLDCRVYARAAASVVGIDRFGEEYWEMMEKMFGTGMSHGQAVQNRPIRKKRESSIW